MKRPPQPPFFILAQRPFDVMSSLQFILIFVHVSIKYVLFWFESFLVD